MWLQHMGVGVTMTSDGVQIEVSCGNVAARATALMFNAGASMCTVYVGDAANQQWINVANQLFGIAGRRSFFMEQSQLYLLTQEIRELDHPAERAARTANNDQQPVVPCHGWPLTIGSLDWIMCCVAESIVRYAFASQGAPPAREFFITNTRDCRREGSHWISVAIEMSWNPVQEN
jgi:hypothetical protein